MYPNAKEPYMLLGKMYLEHNDKEQAAKYYSILTEVCPADEKKWDEIAYLYKDAHNYNSAAYCFKRALKSDNENSILWKECSFCYEKVGKIAEAIKCLNKIIKMD